MSRYIKIDKLPNYEVVADAKCGPITEEMKFIMLPYEHLSDIPTAEQEIIDQIASFFEQPSNWYLLRNVWLENGYSPHLRRLLRKALEEE